MKRLILIVFLSANVFGFVKAQPLGISTIKSSTLFVKSNEGSYLKDSLLDYVHLISRSSYPDDQKLLLLRKAMNAAITSNQKKLILKEIGQTNTFPAMVFSGTYLDDHDLQQEAAMAVVNIALANQAFYGDIVNNLLNRSIKIIKGPGSKLKKQSIHKYLSAMPGGDGFVSLFNNKDLSGWKGLVANPIKRAQMDAPTLKAEQEKADAAMYRDWGVTNGELVFSGKGYDNITTVKKYKDFEMLVDWRIYNDGNKNGDAGIYLRGSPQVQIWDTSRVSSGAQVGSGGLFNNKINISKPLKVADNPLGEWNSFRITMVGEKVTVYLNGELVTDNIVLENYWNRNMPIFPEEQIELQAHGSRVAYRDIYIREIGQQK